MVGWLVSWLEQVAGEVVLESGGVDQCSAVEDLEEEEVVVEV